MAKAAEESSEPKELSTNMASCDFDPSAEFQGDLAVSDDVPTQEILDKAADLPVLAVDGSSHPFKSLYSGEGVARRVLVVFVRHFFCGVSHLSLLHFRDDGSSAGSI
jgi:hypothetical protein